jgi:predicted RNA-binding Zn ribbon-like protein
MEVSAMDKPVSKAASLNLVGGRISLDFVNTADWHGSEEPVEYLTAYEELLKWGNHAGLLSGSELEALLRESESRPLEAEKVHKEALELREALLRIFYAVNRLEQPSRPDLDIFNAALSQTMAHLNLSLATKQGTFTWSWQETVHALDRMLWPVIKDAADLLTSPQLGRVSRCADDKCGWLFLDTSRNRSRRWCDMKDCGNRAKVRRHYHKSRK